MKLPTCKKKSGTTGLNGGVFEPPLMLSLEGGGRGGLDSFLSSAESLLSRSGLVLLDKVVEEGGTGCDNEV